MARPFFITGLPRSRTAWFAVATTACGSVCHHEPGFGDYETAVGIWSAPTDVAVGISDAGLGLHLSRVLVEVRPRTLIIDRDPDECMRSFARYSGLDTRSVFHRCAPAMAELKAALAVDHPLVKRVRYEALDDIGTVRECTDWLGVRPLNLEQMMHMNVQSDWRFNVAKLEVA